MMKGKVGIRDLPIEIAVEADTKQRLEDALEAAFNVAMRMKSRYLMQGAYREPETQADEVIHIAPAQTKQPPARGGLSPAEVSEAKPERALSYEGAETIADYVRIAMDDLGKLYGTDRSYTNREILDHLALTGGDGLIRDNKRPTGAIGQAIRNSDEFIRNGADNRLAKWDNYEEQSSELVRVSDVSSFEF